MRLAAAPDQAPRHDRARRRSGFAGRGIYSRSAALYDRRMAEAVLFDLLTALLDSWSLWNAAAGSPAAGRAWRGEYLRLTYGCGDYRPYETLVREAARTAGVDEQAAV